MASFISLPWLASGSVYYLAEHQAPLNALDASDAGRATAGCPTILLKANKGSNLTIRCDACHRPVQLSDSVASAPTA